MKTVKVTALFFYVLPNLVLLYCKRLFIKSTMLYNIHFVSKLKAFDPLSNAMKSRR